MKGILEFIRSTLIGGIVFLIPLAVMVAILVKAHEALGKIIEPLARALPIAEVGGIGVAKLLAALILLLFAFLMGLFARSAVGSRIGTKIESAVLRKVPGFTLLKNMTKESGAAEYDEKMKVALANIDDAWLIAFIMEEKAKDGLLTVFVPSAPTPTAGSLYFLKEEQVRRLDVSVGDAVKCIMQLGVGSGELLVPRRLRHEPAG
jgi:uncharacterized membrane protein